MPHWTKEDKRQVKYAIDDLIGPRMTDSEFQDFVRWSGKTIDKLVAAMNKQRKPKTSAPTSGLSDEMIQRARDYDISLLFPEAKGGMVKCCFHDDNRPSASIKRGFLMCFVCNKSWDVLDVKMQLDNCDFQTAVRGLQ